MLAIDLIQTLEIGVNRDEKIVLFHGIELGMYELDKDLLFLKLLRIP